MQRRDRSRFIFDSMLSLNLAAELLPRGDLYFDEMELV
jgi:hypothetical protein